MNASTTTRYGQKLNSKEGEDHDEQSQESYHQPSRHSYHGGHRQDQLSIQGIRLVSNLLQHPRFHQKVKDMLLQGPAYGKEDGEGGAKMNKKQRKKEEQKLKKKSKRQNEEVKGYQELEALKREQEEQKQETAHLIITMALHPNAGRF